MSGTNFRWMGRSPVSVTSVLNSELVLDDRACSELMGVHATHHRALDELLQEPASLIGIEVLLAFPVKWGGI